MKKTEIIKIYPRLFGANTYILTADGKNAVVIDPSKETIVGELEKRNLTPAYVLLTHSHFDHIGGVPALKELGAKVVCAEKELPAFGTTSAMGEGCGYPSFPLKADILCVDGEELCLAGVKLSVLETPGHTVGSVCYLLKEEGVMFSGDTLFEGSIGRTDLPTGSVSQMRQSLRKLNEINEEYIVYAGHGEETTLRIEKGTNPFLLDA